MKSTYTKRNGHERYKHVHKNFDSAATARRQSALTRLEIQLTRPNLGYEAELTPEAEKKSRSRIQKEIVTLQERIKHAGHGL